MGKMYVASGRLTNGIQKHHQYMQMVVSVGSPDGYRSEAKTNGIYLNKLKKVI